MSRGVLVVLVALGVVGLGSGYLGVIQHVMRRGENPEVLRGHELRNAAVASCQDTAATSDHVARLAASEWSLQVTEDPDSARYLDTQGMVSGADPNWVHREVRCRWDSVTKATTRITIR